MAVRSFSRGYGGYRFDIGGYFPRAIKTICIICVSVFFLQEISQLLFGAAGWNFWLGWFGLRPYAVVFGFRVWQPFTYIFLHGGILHILFNLLYLAMFGADLEHTWGARKFYTYFFICGVGAGVIEIIVKLLLDPHGLQRGGALDLVAVRSFSRGYGGYRFDIGGYFPRAIKTICIICIAVFFLQEISQLIFGLRGWNWWLVWFGLVP